MRLLLLGFILLPLGASLAADPHVEAYLSLPRLTGASLGLTIEPQDDEDEEPGVARLDYLVSGDDFFLRIAFESGPQSGQRVLARLFADRRMNAFYAYHPLLGLDVVSRAQIGRQFSAAGLPLDALIEVLYPQRSGDSDTWSGRVDGAAVVLLGPAGETGCRNAYHVPAGRYVLPRRLVLCTGRSDRRMQVWLEEPFLFRGVYLPGVLRFQDEWGRQGLIRLTADVTQQYADPTYYVKERLAGQ